MVMTSNQRMLPWVDVPPSGWSIDKMFRLAKSISSGGTPQSTNPEYYDGPIPWVQTGDLNDDYVSVTDKTITEHGLSNSSAKVVPIGSLVIAMYGATIGKLGILDIDAATNQACCIITPSSKLETKFLFYMLFAMRQHLIVQAYGGGQPNISQEVVKQEYFYYPKTEEQTRIAQYLDQTCAAIDRAIAVKQQQLEKLDQLGNSIISQVVLQGLGNNSDKQPVDSPWFEWIPAGWSLRRLKDAVSIQTGITLGKDYDGELVERPYLRVANVQDGYLDLDEVKTISLPERDVSRYLLQPNDVLMTEGGDLDKLGRGQVWRGEIADCLHQNHVFAIRCNESMLLPEYLAYLTSSRHGRNYFEITGKRTTNLASTNSTKVGQFPVPLPPVDEQRGIIKYLGSELGKIEKVAEGVRRQVDVLTDYKKSLIHECVTGKRRITEADLRQVS